jgi:hypothetical protein
MEEVVVLLLNCLIVVGITLFIQKCFQSGMILRRYYVLLNYLWIKWRKPKDRYKRLFLKPIGLCCYCMMPYIAIILGLFIYGFNILMIISLISISYLMLEIFKIKFKI